MNPIEGEKFLLTMEEVEQLRLDTEVAKTFLTPEQLKQAAKTVQFTQFRTTKKVAKDKFVPPQLGPNITPEALADFLGEAREQESYYKKLAGFYKAALAGRLGLLAEPDKEG